MYKILNKICMVIAPSKDKFGEIEWNYVGGCFSDGPARYEDGIPGEIYKFDNVEIEVRHKEDPFVIAIGATDDNVHFSHSNTILWIFAIILVGAGAGCGALFLMNWRKLDSAGEGHARFNDES